MNLIFLRSCVYLQVILLCHESTTMDWEDFHRPHVILEWMDEIARENPSVAETRNIGYTYEDRPIKLIRVGFPSIHKKKAFLIEGALRGFEPLSVAVITWFVNELLHNQDKYSRLLFSLDFYFIPLVNVDGYDFSQRTGVLWGKNRKNTSDPACPGVNVNRNWPIQFGGAGVVNQPCDPNYPGPAPLSEEENKARKEFIEREGKTAADWKVYIGIPIPGQKILLPFAFTKKPVKDLDELYSVAHKVALAISGVSSTPYTVGVNAQINPKHSGSAQDWMKLSGNFKYSYEILPRGHFLTSRTQDIEPAAQEIWAGLVVLANYIRDNNV